MVHATLQPCHLLQLLWDEDDRNVFVAASSSGRLAAYLFTPACQSVTGQGLQLLCASQLGQGQVPLVLVGGRLTVRLKSGALDTLVLDSHRPLLEQDAAGSKQLQKRCARACATCICMLMRLLQAPSLPCLA